MRSVALTSLLVFAGCQNFHAVEAGRVFRTAQPDEQEVELWIKEHGIRSILRLRGGGPGRPSYDAVRRPAEAANVHFEHQPMSAVRWPERERLLSLWAFFESAEYPLLIHCQGGADRTGLASALYVLHRTDDLELAREQLDFIPYLHTGYFGTEKMDRVLDEYEPWHGRISFPRWVRTLYGIGRTGR